MRTAQRVEARRKLKSSSLLRQLKAFQLLDQRQFDICIDLFEFLEYENGATILLQGEEATQFMVLVRGTCKVMQHGINDGSDERLQRTIRQMHAPCFFAESALLFGETTVPRRTASVMAATDSGLSVYILSLKRDIFHSLIEDGILSKSSATTTREAALQSSRAVPESESTTSTIVQVASKEDTPLNIKNRTAAKRSNDKHTAEDEDVVGHTAVFDKYERELAEKNEERRRKSRASLDVRLHARNVLKKTPIFQDWEAEDVQAVVGQMHAREFRAGTRICIEGDTHADEFFIITKGRVRVHQEEENATSREPSEEADEEQQEVIRELTKFDSFGLAALTSGEEGAVRTASCTAVGPVKALVLCRDTFNGALRQIEAKRQTLENIDQNIKEETAGDRRGARGSVCDALGAVAGMSLQAHLAQDLRRREAAKAAKAAVATGLAPTPPPRKDEDEDDAEEDMFI
jgi:CRP-like cAMP-binding protein